MIKVGPTELLGAFWPTLALLGASLVFAASVRRESAPLRMGMTAVSLALLARYFLWRATSTLPSAGFTLDFAVGLIFLVVESGGVAATALSLVLLSRTRDRSSEADRNAGWLDALPQRPLIDVFICSYNEDESILERTIVGAQGMDYRNYRVWMLDDGGRPWLRALCENLNCGYIARPDNADAKAGNINYALAKVAQLPNPPQFISILDADFVPAPEFLSRAMTLFHDDGVGIVQTPQHFINPDPIQTNLLASRVWPDDQRFFFDVAMPAKDAWSTAFCCGTSSIIRFEPLRAIGGFPTDSVTEDYLLTLRMKETGFRTVYLNEPLSLGLAPEGLKEYVTQRSRWCLGFMQIARGRSGPLSRRSSLTFIDRLSLVESFLNWTTVYPAKLMGLIVPILYLLLGIRSMRADMGDAANYFLPYFIWSTLTMSWLTRGRQIPIMSDVCHLIAAPEIIKAVLAGLLKPQGQKFHVTAKGGDRGRRFVEWPLLRIFGALLLLTIASIGYAFHLHVRGDGVEFGVLALFWSWYNSIILLLACFVCIEQPRRRKAERFEANDLVTLTVGGASHLRQLIDISISGAQVAGVAPAPSGAAIECRIGNSAVEARIVRVSPRSFALSFDGSISGRYAMIRHFYSNQYVKAIESVNVASVTKVVARRLFQ